MAQDFQIEDGDLRRFIFGLSQSDKAMISRAGRYLKQMGNHTERKMKQFAKSKTDRSTGILSSSITTKYVISDVMMYAEVAVPPEIKYQFAAEYGIQRRFVIRGRPKMSFSVESWKRARTGIVAVPHRGYYVFTQIKRGKYKGRFFTKRAFESLERFYASKVANKMPDDLIRALSFGR